MKRRIVLHGHLKKLVPGPLELEVSTVAEAVEALCVVTGNALKPKPGCDKHRIRAIGFDQPDSFRVPLSDDVTELHFVPDFTGGKQGGVIQIALGVVLIVVGAIMMSPIGGANPYGMPVLMMGVSMLLGGVIAMLSPAPRMNMPDLKNTNGVDPEASKYLGGPRNTTRIGTRIPVIYGKFKHYGHVLSANVDAMDVAV